MGASVVRSPACVSHARLKHTQTGVPARHYTICRLLLLLPAVVGRRDDKERFARHTS